MTIGNVMLAPVELALNRLVALDPGAANRITGLAGKLIAVEVRGIDLRMYFLCGRGDVGVSLTADREPDATICGTPLALAKLLVDRDSKAPFFSGDVAVEGDLEVAKGLQQVLVRADIDWEEQLARLVGDVLARQVSRLFHHTRVWGQRTAGLLGENTKEYLQEESRLLPCRHEVAAFMDGVDRLRGDVDRLAVRLARLESKKDRADDETPS